MDMAGNGEREQGVNATNPQPPLLTPGGSPTMRSRNPADPRPPLPPWRNLLLLMLLLNQQQYTTIAGGGGLNEGWVGDTNLHGGEIRIDMNALVELIMVNCITSNGAGGGTNIDELQIRFEQSDSSDKYTKILIVLLPTCAGASWAAYPVIEQAVGPAYAPFAYSFLWLLLIILALGSFVAVKFDTAPWSRVFGKYVLLLSLAILVGLSTWVFISLIMAA